MSVPHPPSGPVEQSCPSAGACTADDSYGDLTDRKHPQKINGTAFLESYLQECSFEPPPWSPLQNELISHIKATQNGQEGAFYNSVPLLRFLNSISESVFNTVSSHEALVFRAGDGYEITSPFTPRDHHPDIVGIWERAQTFPQLHHPNDHPSRITWCALATVGGKQQLAIYVRNHLQLHPELNGVLGFTASSTGYSLFYHDAAAIHRAKFSWEQLGPLYGFVQKLYARPFRDISMQVLDSERPAWATKVGDDIYLSETPEVLAGPGQRRYTALAFNLVNDEMVFIKDIWRDDNRLFFEGSLFEQAHEGKTLPGLMMVHAHGHVLDNSQKPVRITYIQPHSTGGLASVRYKMRMVTKEIGRPIEGLCGVRQFLCTMYDACVVQRNLYRKCRILHRDISKNNIMFAPDTDEYRRRCAEGYAEVRFANQVISKDKDCAPVPTCLVIDLGNGADLKVRRGQEALTELTGTPKFIARSVSLGKVLNRGVFNSISAEMPPMEGPLGEYSRFMHDKEYQVLHGRELPPASEPTFAHQLFHDAESTFWVIAWILARSVREGSRLEETPHIDFREFFHTMSRHYPIPGQRDSRSKVCEPSTEYWEAILHPSLAFLAPMLSGMYAYIQPEWAHRPELDAEHVHEALMRLLLAEIVRIDTGGEDISIVVGGRAEPLHPDYKTPLSSSTESFLSQDKSPLLPQKSMEMSSYSHSGEGSNDAAPPETHSKSQSDTPQMLDLSRTEQEPTPVPDTAADYELEGPNLRMQLRGRASLLEWKSGAGNLQEPAQVNDG